MITQTEVLKPILMLINSEIRLQLDPTLFQWNPIINQSSKQKDWQIGTLEKYLI